MAQIEDFGQKIGGARKDMWKLNGITASDFNDMNDMERTTFVKKDNVWIKPDWEALIAKGTPQAVAYWQNKMRQSIPPKPPKAGEEAQRNYIAVVSQLRDAVMDVQNEFEIKTFFRDFLLPNFTTASESSWHVHVNEEADGIVNNKVLKTAQANYRTMEREARKKLFGVPKKHKAYFAAKQDLKIYHYDGNLVSFEPDAYQDGYTRMTIKNGLGCSYFYFSEASEYHDIDKWEKGTYFVLRNGKPVSRNIPNLEQAEQFVEGYALTAQIADNTKTETKDKSDGKRKQNFVPPQLAHVKYTGPDYRQGRPVNGQMYLDELKFRAGEFGNWLNDNDRQTSLNMGYEALRNLADILKISPEDVSLNGSLAIAFGARGRGGASAGAAHYEPLRQVINLTKMSGAGCLAHEWGHALDHAIGILCGTQDFASEEKSRKSYKIPDSFTEVMSKLKYKEVMVSADDLRKDVDKDIEKAKRNLRNWINSVKPSKLPDDLNQTWEETAKHIMENPSSFTGGEYYSFRRSDPVTTHPDVELLSQLSKFATNHVIPRDAKQQIALWANMLNSYIRDAEKVQPAKSVVETDFFKDSKEFDKIYSKMGHGYWQSNCEMFARAFDCYIADKVREQGYRSDYLSSNADSFKMNIDGRTIAAFPVGEERAAINQAFDNLFQDLKERQFLHEAPIMETVIDTPPLKSTRSARSEAPLKPDKPVHYEQLSLDEMLFSAASRASQGTTGRHGNLSDRSR